MGGIEPARGVRARRHAGRQVTSSPRTSSCCPTTARSCGQVAREHGVQLRFEAAVAGVVPVIRVLQESLAGAHVDRITGIVNGTTNFILSQMAQTGATYAEPRSPRRRQLGYARGRPDRRRDRPGRRGEDGDPRAPGLRHPGPHRPGRLRGHRAHHPRGSRVRPRSRAGPEARSGPPSASGRASRSASTPRSSTPATPSPAVSGTVQRGDDRVARHHRDHPQRARARAARRPRAPCSATS